MDDENKKTYTLEGWPTKSEPGAPPDLSMVPLPHSYLVRAWCQAGKKVRITFEVVE